jgi:hypothetical protein
VVLAATLVPLVEDDDDLTTLGFTTAAPEDLAALRLPVLPVGDGLDLTEGGLAAEAVEDPKGVAAAPLSEATPVALLVGVPAEAPSALSDGSFSAAASLADGTTTPATEAAAALGEELAAGASAVAAAATEGELVAALATPAPSLGTEGAWVALSSATVAPSLGGTDDAEGITDDPSLGDPSLGDPSLGETSSGDPSLGETSLGSTTASVVVARDLPGSAASLFSVLPFVSVSILVGDSAFSMLGTRQEYCYLFSLLRRREVFTRFRVGKATAVVEMTRSRMFVNFFFVFRRDDQ